VFGEGGGGGRWELMQLRVGVGGIGAVQRLAFVDQKSRARSSRRYLVLASGVAGGGQCRGMGGVCTHMKARHDVCILCV